jgi:hypothetical protein
MSTKNIYQKIAEVSQLVKNIEKNLQIGVGNYAYKAVGDQDVMLAVKEAENSVGLVSIPIKQDLISSEVIKTIDKDGKEKLTFHDNIKMTLRIINLDNTSEFLDVETFGKGIDNGDKGFGKASTYARKYALLNAYKIATGADPDQNKNEDKKVVSTPSEKRLAVENFLNANVPALQNILKHYNVGDLTMLTEKQFV